MRGGALLPLLALTAIAGVSTRPLLADEAPPLCTSVHRIEVSQPPEMPGLPPVSGTITARIHLVTDPGSPPEVISESTGIAGHNLRKAAATEEASVTEMVFISATVYDHSRTFLRWSCGSSALESTAWSNVDFNNFSGPAQFRIQSADGTLKDYVLLMALSNESAPPAPVPSLPLLSADGPTFIAGATSDPKAMQVMTDLHSFYRTHAQQLAADLAIREAASRERLAFLTAHPQTLQDVDIRFWKKGAGNPAPVPSNAAARSMMQTLSEEQPAIDPRLSISKEASGGWNLTWQGQEGRTDFVQCSLDLATWFYAPVIEYGVGAKSYGADSTAPEMFFRLASSDLPADVPEDADFDGDKVSNFDELAAGTDPLKNSDDDGDGIPSDWETRFLLDPHDPIDATADRDGDGISNLAEFTAGTDPTDYYNGRLAICTVFSGNLEYGEPNTFSADPLVAMVRVNGTLSPHSPVRIETAPPALISLSSDGSNLTNRIDTLTDANGRVIVFFKHGPEATINNVYFSTGSELTSSRPVSIASAITQPQLIYPPGTLGRDATDAIDGRIAGKNSVAAKPVFSVQDHDAATYVRNTGCWAYDLRQQMTCISPWNSMDGAKRAGVSITPRHVLNAAHFVLEPGTIIRFVTADNVVVDRTIVSKVIHPDYQANSLYPDLAIYTLDADLPPSITPCRLLPSDYASALGSLSSYHPPALGLDQEEKALIFDLGEISAAGSSQIFSYFHAPTIPLARSPYHEDLNIGDSGNPAFLILHDSLVLVTVWTTNAVGTFAPAFLSDLNTMIGTADAQAGVSTGYQLQTADLSSYLPFSP